MRAVGLSASRVRILSSLLNRRVNTPPGSANGTLMEWINSLIAWEHSDGGMPVLFFCREL
jgi:hypothetical protein